MYIVLAILAFGLLIAVHELGHFMAAKACHVKVNEFAIGMGPKLLKKQGKETLYTLRLLPIGGFCAMEGEDESSENPRSFTNQPRWKRVIILIAGATMNFITGFVLVLIIFSQMASFGGTTITQLADGFPNQGANGLQQGDTILSIDGQHLYYSSDFTNFMARANGKPVDMVILRDGKTVTLTQYDLTPRDYTEDGQTVRRYGTTFNQVKATVWEQLKYSTYTSFNFVRLIWLSLEDLVSGAIGIKDLAGPVGIVSAINQAGHASTSTVANLSNVGYLVAFIAVNLAFMNLLPLPALDGGRIFFLIVTWFIEKIIRKRINPKYEGYIHTAGFVLIIGLMIFVMANDVVRLFNA